MHVAPKSLALGLENISGMITSFSQNQNWEIYLSYDTG